MDTKQTMHGKAEERAASLKQAANEYCADALRRTEDAVAEAYSEIKESHDHFRALVTSGSSDAASAICEKAANANVPVIFFNRSVSESVVSGYDN